MGDHQTSPRPSISPVWAARGQGAGSVRALDLYASPAQTDSSDVPNLKDDHGYLRSLTHGPPTCRPAAMLECQSPGVWWRAVGMTAEDARRAPWQGDWDEVVLRLLASGVVELADRVVSGHPVRLPYPVSLQRVLDRLSVASESSLWPSPMLLGGLACPSR